MDECAKYFCGMSSRMGLGYESVEKFCVCVRERERERVKREMKKIPL